MKFYHQNPLQSNKTKTSKLRRREPSKILFHNSTKLQYGKKSSRSRISWQRFWVFLQSRSRLQRHALQCIGILSLLSLFHHISPSRYRDMHSTPISITAKEDRMIRLEELGYKAHPLVFAYHFQDNHISKALRIDPYDKLYPNKRQIEIDNDSIKAQLLLTMNNITIMECEMILKKEIVKRNIPGNCSPILPAIPYMKPICLTRLDSEQKIRH